MTTHSSLTGSNLHIARAGSGAGAPIGSRTPTIVGELYYDTTNKVVYIANGTTNTSWEVHSKGFFDGFSYQSAAISFWDIQTYGVPASPSAGDRYIASSFDGTWDRNNIYEYDGNAWSAITPTDGMMTWVSETKRYYVFNVSTDTTITTTEGQKGEWELLLPDDVQESVYQFYNPTVAYPSTGVKQIDRVTAPAFAATTQADYIMLYNRDDESTAVWLNRDDTSTKPDIIGTLAGGFDWATTPQDFYINVNGTGAAHISLVNLTATRGEVVTHLNNLFTAAGINADVEAYDTGAFVAIRTIDFGSLTSITLSAGAIDALAGSLGMAAGTITGTDGAVPTGADYVASDYQVKVNITTGWTATQIGTAFYNACSGIVRGMTFVDNVDGTVDLTQVDVGALTTAHTPHNEDDSGPGSIAVATSTPGSGQTTAGRYICRTPSGRLNNIATITILGAVIDANTLTFGTDVYEFDVPPDGVVPGNILVDVSADNTAIGVAGFLAAAMTANSAYAADITFTDNGDGTITVASNINSTVDYETYNALATTTTEPNVSLQAATFGGVGVDQVGVNGWIRRANNQATLTINGNVLDTETVTFGPETYEFDTDALPGNITAGNIRVGVTVIEGGTGQINAATQLAAAIVANTTLTDITVTDNLDGTITFSTTMDSTTNYENYNGIDTTETMSAVGSQWQALTFGGTGVDQVGENGWIVDNIYEWNGEDWIEVQVDTGTLVYIDNLQKHYEWDGTSWKPWTHDYDPQEGVIRFYDPTYFLPGANSPERTLISCSGGADTTQADYIMVYDSLGNDTAVWLDIDADGTAPTGALYAGSTTQIEVDILSGDTNIQVATKVHTAISGIIPNITFVDNLDGTITATDDANGACTHWTTQNEDDTDYGTMRVMTQHWGTTTAQSNGDRYLCGATANGWTINRLYEWNGIDWIEMPPNDGFFLWNQYRDQFYHYDGTQWLRNGYQFEWQNSIRDFYDPVTAVPHGPQYGERYISSTTNNGWTADYVYEWNGFRWMELIPEEGTSAWIDVVDTFYTYNGTAWVESIDVGDWQDSVISFYDPTGGLPVGPAIEDRYISTATANGWVQYSIYEWNGSTWIEHSPDEGTATWVENLDRYYIFNTVWEIFKYNDDFQDGVESFYDPTGGLPGAPANNERHVSLATANGWTVNYIYEYNGVEWAESTPSDGMMVWDQTRVNWYVYTTVDGTLGWHLYEYLGTEAVDRDIYVNAATGSDLTGTGLVGAPFQTIPRALADIGSFIAATITIRLTADAVHNVTTELTRYLTRFQDAGIGPSGSSPMIIFKPVVGSEWSASLFNDNMAGNAYFTHTSTADPGAADTWANYFLRDNVSAEIFGVLSHTTGAGATWELNASQSFAVRAIGNYDIIEPAVTINCTANYLVSGHYLGVGIGFENLALTGGAGQNGILLYHGSMFQCKVDTRTLNYQNQNSSLTNCTLNFTLASALAQVSNITYTTLNMSTSNSSYIISSCSVGGCSIAWGGVGQSTQGAIQFDRFNNYEVNMLETWDIYTKDYTTVFGNVYYQGTIMLSGTYDYNNVDWFIYYDTGCKVIQSTTWGAPTLNEGNLNQGRATRDGATTTFMHTNTDDGTVATVLDTFAPFAYTRTNYHSRRRTSTRVYNNSGGLIAAFRVIRVSAYNVGLDVPEIAAIADYGDTPFGVTIQGLNNGNPCDALQYGLLETNLNTVAAALEDPVYCDDSGVLTLTKTRLKIGTVASLAANGWVMVNIGGFGGSGIEVTPTVAAAELAPGIDDDMIFIVETETFYRYEDTAGTFTDDNTYVLSTADGGNTRWLAVGGKYHYLNLATVTRVGALTVDGAVNLINTDLALYVVPALTYPQRIKITAVNRNSGSIAKVRIAHIDGAIGAIANEDYAWYDISLLNNESKWIELDGMSPADTILVRSDTTDVNFIATAVVLAEDKGFSRIAATTVAAGTNTALITTAGTQYEECSLLICNRSAVAASYRFALIDGAIGAIADEDYIVYNEAITANESLNFGETFHLPDGYTLAVRSTTANVNFILYGKRG